MNASHLHLIVNHAPIFFSFAGILVAIWAWIRRVNESWAIAFGFWILSGISGGAAYVSGGSAEDAVKNLPGVAESTIEAHQDAATPALVLAILLGLVGLVALFGRRIAARVLSVANLRIIAFVLALTTFGYMAYAANLGGAIHHQELLPRANALLFVPPNETKHRAAVHFAAHRSE